jgi:arylsulfatase
MTRRFEGAIEVDVRNSKEDWSAFTQPDAPKGSPNVVIILWDDTGIASWDFWGGLVKMPYMQRIADQGLLYTQEASTETSGRFCRYGS